MYKIKGVVNSSSYHLLNEIDVRPFLIDRCQGKEISSERRDSHHPKSSPRESLVEKVHDDVRMGLLSIQVDVVADDRVRGREKHDCEAHNVSIVPER